MLNPSPDPHLVSLSASVYRALLAFYPPRFRREYGPHMAQVYRDCCLKTYRQSGPPGMLALWALTLFDWFKTVIEEHVFREVEMTRTKWIRLSGWAMMVGPVSMFIGFGEPAEYRRLLINVFGAPANQQRHNNFQFLSETLPFLLALAGMVFIFLGFWGWYAYYREKVGKLGHFSLRMCVISSGVTALGGALSFTGTDTWWYIFLIGFLATFIFVALFGITVFRGKILPRWNALPLFTGLWFPGTLGIGLILGLEENPYILILPMFFSLLGLIGMGYLLQADAAREEGGR